MCFFTEIEQRLREVVKKKKKDDNCIGKKETYKMLEMKKIMGDDQTFWPWEMILFSRGNPY